MLGFPDNVWGTSAHLAFLGPVVIVTIVSTASAAMIEAIRCHSKK